jgi:S-adenosylmethionine hydrolase
VPGKIEGKVVSVDASGSLVTDIAVDRLRSLPAGAQVTVTCDEHETIGLFGPDHQEPEMTFLALLGGSGALELVIVGDSAHAMLGIGVGEKVVVKW